ncbi:hypothetical protein CCMSSC00406_0008873 [Pleurotus cornucopiae]|uniref:Uncharacterized protein n=1 Tax=Pleurotus cornucopiae TaxID=5321 RepID=A0ACB7ILG1_PLECO|nr:hypothetical protein CCMSSC00406_0008873 [Pleurotus cornucopiae]
MSGLPDRPTPMPQSMYEEIYGKQLPRTRPSSGLSLATVFRQAYLYYISYPKDSLRMKTLVGSIWVLATLHAIFRMLDYLHLAERLLTLAVSHTVWHYSVKSYTRPEILPDGEWSVYAGVTVGIFICFVLQIFFVRMIYLSMAYSHSHLYPLPNELCCEVTKRWRKLLTGTMILLLAAQTGFGVYFAYSLFHLWDLLRLHEAVFTAMVPYYILRVVLDATVSATLCIILYDARGFTKSMKLIKTLLVYSMNRFLLTTIVVIAQTIILIAKPESIWAMVIEFISAQLYVNSFLAMLNSRNRLRNIGGQESVYVYSNSRQGVSAVSVPRFKRESYGETQRGEEDKYPASDAISGIRVGTETVALSDFSLEAKAEANRAALERA